MLLEVIVTDLRWLFRMFQQLLKRLIGVCFRCLFQIPKNWSWPNTVFLWANGPIKDGRFKYSTM